MVNINSFFGVSVAGMSLPLHVAGVPAAAAHPAAPYAAAAEGTIMPRARRTTAATVASVNRGTT
jgi:hypothetical protein